MPTQNTSITEVDGSQPLLHQHGYEIQQYGTLRDLLIVLNLVARSESCVLVNQILADTHHWYAVKFSRSGVVNE
ncbi:hypothetical protein [Nostoc sp.]